MEKSPEEQKKQMAENRKKIYQIFDDAQAYYLARQADPNIKVDSRWEAMVPVLTGELSVFIMANDYRQIEQAVSFAREYNLTMILVGGADAWMLTDLLKENSIPVILKRTQSLPMREDEGYDLAYRLPALMAEAGIKFCLSTAGSGGGSATSVRNLPLQAGQATAFGLSRQEALRAVTLSTAEILGVADDLGSLNVGKKATLVVSEGDVLDPLTHNVVLEFIEGRRVDLDNKHKELNRKYRQKRFEPK
jgi:imidazolonepropionase-like amidohydrolase